MSDIMRPIPFAALVNQMVTEKEISGRMFGVDLAKAYRSGGHQLMSPLGTLSGSATGPAAGPHTQLAQNILAAYIAGGRFIELKTVQTMDGQALREAIAKPCINAADEGYNVEWSTELTVEEALDEYIKAWFMCHVAMKELNLAQETDFAFNMSVGYTLDGIKSSKIDNFIEGLKNASQVKVYEECKAILKENLHRFEYFTQEDIDGISPNICNSLTLSTMHGCPKEEIESIVSYLISEKQLNVYLKCNPTLLGYSEARRLVDELGFDYLSFDTVHFDQDLKFEEAVPMIEKLLALADANGRKFGAKLTNTFPVEIKRDELPGQEMYSSGRVLLPLTIHVAKKLSEVFGNRLPLAYSGGADAFNSQDLVEAGIFPVTVCTTLLKPGGYERLAQISEAAKPAMKLVYTGPDKEKIARLADAIMLDRRNHKSFREAIVSRKTNSALGLYDCFKAPCKDGGCPINQNIPAYLELVAKGQHLAAMAVIAQDNAMPAMLGEICYHPCTKRCTRLDYDQSLDIRGMKHLAVEAAMEEYVGTLTKPQANGKKVLVIGAGVQGLSLAYYLSRGGFAVLVAEKKEQPFGILNNIKADKGLTDRALELDLKLVTAYGAQIQCNVTPEELLPLTQGMDYVISTTGRNEGIESALMTVKTKETRLEAVYAMAESKKLALELLAKADAKPLAEIKLPKEPAKIYEKRGILVMALEGPAEGNRCLHCNDICEVCTEVCPNRANVAITVPGFENIHQILHLDYSCNECGNCTTFCPHAGRPYTDKVTLFGTARDFEDSENAGFFISQDQVLVRYADRTKETTTLDGIREAGLKLMARTVVDHYPHLLINFGGVQ